MIDPGTRPTKRFVATLTQYIAEATGVPYLRGHAGNGHHLVAFAEDPDEKGRPRWSLYLSENPRQRTLPLPIYRHGEDGPPGAPRRPQNCKAIER